MDIYFKWELGKEHFVLWELGMGIYYHWELGFTLFSLGMGILGLSSREPGMAIYFHWERRSGPPPITQQWGSNH